MHQVAGAKSAFAWAPNQGEHLKTVQKVLGHKSAATTTIYQDVTEQEVRDVLKKAGRNYDN